MPRLGVGGWNRLVFPKYKTPRPREGRRTVSESGDTNRIRCRGDWVIVDTSLPTS